MPKLRSIPNHRLLAAWFLVWSTAAGMLSAQEATPQQFGTVVEVRRIVTEVRVVAHDGSPVLGLEPEDFTVKVGGDRADVESVSWIASTADAAARGRSDPGREVPEKDLRRSPEGRLVVIMFQIDFGLQGSRTKGLLRMSPQAEEFVSNLGPDDRVAMVVYGSHLQLRADFTGDHDEIVEMLGAREILRNRQIPPDPSGPSLAEHLDPQEMKDAASMARALEILGLALDEIEGAKSLVLFGYALGKMSAGARVTIDDGYRRAMEALSKSRTSVFSLDITDADYHSLELGLRQVAEDTGGFYIKTHLFPEVAMAKLTRVISSYYELSIIPPPGLEDEYSIRVKVKRPRTDVYVRQDHPSPIVW